MSEVVVYVGAGRTWIKHRRLSCGDWMLVPCDERGEPTREGCCYRVTEQQLRRWQRYTLRKSDKRQ